MILYDYTYIHIYIYMEMISKKQRTFLKAGLFNFNIHNSLGIFRQSLCLCSGPLYLGGHGRWKSPQDGAGAGLVWCVLEWGYPKIIHLNRDVPFSIDEDQLKSKAISVCLGPSWHVAARCQHSARRANEESATCRVYIQYEWTWPSKLSCYAFYCTPCYVMSCYVMLWYVIVYYIMLCHVIYIAMLYLTRTWLLTTAIGSRSIYITNRRAKNTPEHLESSYRFYKIYLVFRV